MRYILAVSVLYLAACSGFEMDSNLVEGVTTNSSSAEVQLKITQTSSTILIESDLTVTGATNVTYTWYKSASISAGQDVSKYSLVGFTGAVLDAAALGASFNGVIMLKVTLQTNVRAYEIYSSPLRLDLSSPQISATPTVTPRPTSTPTAAPTPTVGPTPPPISGAPAWTTSMALGTWKRISNNSLADVDPEDDAAINPRFPSSAPWHGNSGLSCIIGCWNGAALATGYGRYGSMMIWGGGHKDYNGNEVYAFDLESGLFKRITRPYGSDTSYPAILGDTAAADTAYTNGQYADGSPITVHTYDRVEYHPRTNSFLVLAGSNNPWSGNLGVNIAHILNLNQPEITGPNGKLKANWRRSIVNSGGSYGSGASSIYDSKRDIFWMHGARTETLTSYNPNVINSDGTVGEYRNYVRDTAVAIDNMSAYDPVNDILVRTALRDTTKKIRASDLSNPAAPAITLIETGDMPPVKAGASGWEYSKRRQAFIYYHHTAGIYEFKLVSGNWKTGTWRWTKLGNSWGGVDPSNGIYSRMQIINYQGNDFLILLKRFDEPVYAFLIP